MRRFLFAAIAAPCLLSACDGGGLPPPYRDVEVPAARLASAAALDRGRDLYLTNCALCHGERGDGHGRRRNLSSRPQDFTDRRWRRRAEPRRVFYAIREGVEGTGMASWKSLDEEETWDLVAFVLSLAEHGA